MFSGTSTQSCVFHSYNPMPDSCMTCSVVAATRPNLTEMEGTEDFANSIYPEIDANILAGPGFPYKMAPPKSFQAPIANMLSPSFPPMLKVDTGIRFISRYWYPPFEIQALHDHYSEIFALSPKERSQMYAGYHYSDKHALSPIRESRHSFVEEFALSPVHEECRKPARRGRKPKSETKTKIAEPITADVPEEQQRASRSPRTRLQVKDEKHAVSPVEVDGKPTRGRKRKYLAEEEEEVVESVRKSKRSRKAVGYAK